MTDFDLDIDTAKVRKRIKQLKGDWEGNATFVVGSAGVEYAIFP